MNDNSPNGLTKVVADQLNRGMRIENHLDNDDLFGGGINNQNESIDP